MLRMRATGLRCKKQHLAGAFLRKAQSALLHVVFRIFRQLERMTVALVGVWLGDRRGDNALEYKSTGKRGCGWRRAGTRVFGCHDTRTYTPNSGMSFST
jgi:hypothetical protein